MLTVSHTFGLRYFFLFGSLFSILRPTLLPAQRHYEVKSVIYNSLVGAVSGGVGALINKKSNEKWPAVLRKGFLGGGAGGLLMYAGKKSTSLIVRQQNISYAWLARAIFSTGNSIVENAAANQPLLSRFHVDIGFVRLDLYTDSWRVMPRVMPSQFGATIFMAVFGRLDATTSLCSGTMTFRNREIGYAPYLMGSTPGNMFILVDSLYKGLLYHEIYAHEMVHAFQWLELSGFNNFFGPTKTTWESNWPKMKKWNKWVHGDLNYELMLVNYFIIQGGYRRILYCRHFLENEAEVLSVGRVSCPVD
jgi:hypothetical protein